MHKTNLRKVGGSVMLTVPPAFLEQLHLKPGSPVGLMVDHGCLVVNPISPPRYTLEELLVASDYSTEQPEDDEWVSARPVGGELL